MARSVANRDFQRYYRAMISDELNIKQFIERTKEMSPDERHKAAISEIREVDKLPYGRRKGATKTMDRKIERYLLDLKAWINENYY